MNEHIEKTDLLPVIDITERNLPEISRQGWDSLVQANSPPYIFRYANNLVRVVNRGEERIFIEVLDGKRLRHELARCAEFIFMKKDQAIIDLPPTYLVDDMLAEPTPPLPSLLKIVSSPVFSKDGELRIQNGYDPLSRCYLDIDSEINKVPENPSEEEISVGKSWINDLIHDFPFVGKAEKAHAISLFLCPFIRNMVDGPVPLHVIEATAPGTGKTLLAQTLSYPAVGNSLEAMSEGRNDEEMRKRITAKLMRSPTHILIDNVRDKIASSSFAAAITASVWEDRRLGVSQTIRMPVNCIWVITGNNPVLSSEMARRTVRIRLDTGKEQPWLRDHSQFKHSNLLGWVKDHRSELIWAGLTLIRNWISKGEPKPANVQTMGMFEDWCNIMGGVLEVNGISGFLGNLKDLYTTSDIEIETWRSFTEAWWQMHEASEVGTAELFDVVLEKDIPIELGSGTERSQKIKLGIQISRMRHRQFGQYRIVLGKQKNHAQHWRLELVQ